ncbi:tetratricopeptide repeat protein [Mangrovimonas spongiae]|uniref:Tetratricopeptide repeat protein n=2 Tax=Mangrovimonas spongiae TaxID=2494697 RepID=A0A428K0K7_9FLAO|nr:tetratricopeptide repeat protein [Mangrovimonas spongiae]
MVIALCFLSHTTKAQTINTDSTFIKIVNSVLKNKPTHYRHLDSVFKQHKNDSIKMSFLLDKATKANYIEGEGFAHNMLGIIYRNTSQYNKSITHHEQAKTAAKKAKNIELEIVSLNMLGVNYRRQDIIRLALDNHKEALDLAETIEIPSEDLKRSIAVSQNSMGNIFLALKQYDFALGHFKKSLAIEKELNNKLGLAINYHNIGYAQEAKNQIDSALINYKTSLKYNNDINSVIGRIICNNSIAKIEIKKGHYNKALPLINSAIKNATQEKDQFYIATSYLNLGLVQLKLNQLEQANTSLTIALDIAEEYNLKSSVVTAYDYLSQLYEKTHDYKKALKYNKLHQELDETITNDRNLQYANGLIIKYETEKKNNQIQALASENEIVKLKLKQNKNFLLFSIIGGCLALAIMVILYRQHKLKNEKKIITLEQEMLRNQMNPHFIFNSLNSIKLYIINNEKENAVYYLNKFSKLIRKILIASTEKEISLHDELETMALYMNIENIRFSNEIDFSITINDNVNTDLIKVPSLILQPFLENALWHGLSSKSGEKKITLKVSKSSPEFVTISITDNGIGREASRKIREQKKLKRKSVGLDITKARLANFSKHYANDYSIEIIDLYSDNKASGTKVIVNIPVRAIALKTA